MANEDEATWVGGGSFKVDREKALEKLAAYGLQDKDRFLQTWIRAAVANEATRIEIHSSKESLEIEFDGRGFTYDDLRDPYSVLFEGQKEGTEDRRYLAIGILTLLPAKPGAIDLFYGIPGKRFRTTITETTGEKTTRLKEEDRKTRIRVLSLNGSLHSDSAAAASGSVSAVSPARVFINDQEIQRPRHGKTPGVWVEERGFRAWVNLPVDNNPGSLIELSVDGVSLETLQMHDHDIPVRAIVDSSEVSMNADHSRVVQNDRYRALSRKIEATARKLVDFAMRRLKNEFDKDEWNDRAAFWLRSLTDRFLMDDHQHDMKDPFKKLLWECPLYRTVGKEVLSLIQIRRKEQKEGAVRCVVSSSKPADDGSGALWCKDRDEFNSLVARFALAD